MVRGDINDKFLQLKRGLANALFYGSWISFLQNKHTLETYLSNYYCSNSFSVEIVDCDKILNVLLRHFI